MVPLVDMGEADGVREPGVMPWRDLYAEALLRLGRIEETEEVLVKLEGLAKERELASGMAAAARVRGDVEASRGEWELARAAFQGGLEQANEVGMPFLRARLALDYGAFLRRTGQRRQAVAILEEAAELFGSLRSEPFLQRCERELEGSGRQRAPRGTSHLTLTPQELTVARLIARGLTNRAAASELVLSVKTIEYHLSNLYAKLGVGSRTQLIARLAETGQIDFQP
jgi:DNA-binding CsgD family transcriptional regulator